MTENDVNHKRTAKCVLNRRLRLGRVLADTNPPLLQTRQPEKCTKYTKKRHFGECTRTKMLKHQWDPIKRSEAYEEVRVITTLPLKNNETSIRL